ncbi:TonB-dependent receptor domain-containing protein [Pedobacter mucosus]|uniref:TonB-dependent receptor domain-containing protein n=1 Tax=Pedobacter mucosus TaxID=2895286 RepID=UPI001EE461D4|nr:TonB-dependent receptor [Pedobacter mucosus]UKT65926.1 TonB-dependent receptor [Pedobacter mucosus]
MRNSTKSIFIFLLLIFLYTSSNAQTFSVKGIILDTDGQSLPGAVVRIKSTNDSLVTSANTDGRFNFTKFKAKQFTLSAAFIGYDTFIKKYVIENGVTIDITDIKLKASSNTLDGVVISGAPPVKVTQDTVSFNAKAFPVRDGDAVDEILKKLPGIKVDNDGNVTSQGSPVTKIRVNGKDFFGSDVATAIKNLPADIIKNLQVIDDYGDQAKLTGIKTGEPEKILNLVIEEDKKKGYFARASAGIGSSNRYNTNLRGNSMKGEQQISFDGTSANANMRGGGGDGITTRNAAGLNYKNEFNTKLSADAGYNFTNDKRNTISTTYTQNILQDADLNPVNRFEDARSNNHSNNYNQWFGGNLEYKIDTMNYLKISPNLTYGTNEGNDTGGSIITQDSLVTNRNSTNFSNSNNFSARTNVFFNHKFSKKGRNFTGWSNLNFSNSKNDRDGYNRYLNTNGSVTDSVTQNQLNYQANQNIGISAGASYMEPLWAKTFLELNYNWNRSATNNSKDTYDVIGDNQVFNQNLSNIYDYEFITNKVGLNYRFIGEKLNYTIGLNFQPVLLKGYNVTTGVETFNRSSNFIPSGRFSYKFSNQQSLDVNYWARNTQPGFLQLQPISDNSNLQNVTTGNPNLKPEFIQNINAHYKQADWSAGKVILANFKYERTNDRIVTIKQRVPGTVNQLTTYTNTDGYYTIQGDYNISRPLSPERKFTLEYSGSGQLNNNISFTDESRIDAKNTSWRQELEFRVDLKDIANFEVETSYSQNSTSYSNDAFEDRLSNRFEYGIEGRNYFLKDITLGYNFSKQVNSGFDNGITRNPTLLRLSLEYKFLKNKMAAVQIEGFDLFDQNSGISRDVFDNVIVDRQVNRLGRYFMLSLIYRVRNFGG